MSDNSSRVCVAAVTSKMEKLAHLPSFHVLQLEIPVPYAEKELFLMLVGTVLAQCGESGC